MGGKGSLEHEERILDFFNALTDCDEDFEGATLTKVISIHPSRHPSLDFSAPLEGEVPVTGHMTFRIQDEEDTVHTLQLFVPQEVVFEKEVFFMRPKPILRTILISPKPLWRSQSPAISSRLLLFMKAPLIQPLAIAILCPITIPCDG